MVPPAGCLYYVDIYHRPCFRTLREVGSLFRGIVHRLIIPAFLMSRKPRSERSLLFKSTIQKLVELQATSCYYACFSCTRPLMLRFASSPSRPSGIRTIFLFPSSSRSILTLPGASSATQLTHILHLTKTTSGLTA